MDGPIWTCNLLVFLIISILVQHISIRNKSLVFIWLGNHFVTWFVAWAVRRLRKRLPIDSKRSTIRKPKMPTNTAKPCVTMATVFSSSSKLLPAPGWSLRSPCSGLMACESWGAIACMNNHSLRVIVQSSVVEDFSGKKVESMRYKNSKPNLETLITFHLSVASWT